MPRERSPKRNLAYQLWIDSEKKKKLKDIAEELEVSESQIRKWKNQDKWNGNITNQRKGNVTKPNDNRIHIEKKVIVDEVKQVIENTSLTDKQRLFCLHYIKCFNATKAYQRAYECGYETAMTRGSETLRNVKIKEEILRLKQNRLNREFLSAEDIFQKYMDIAFADITDYVSFRQEEVQVMAMYGPVFETNEDTGEKKQVTRVVNSVRFKDSSNVDGTLIQEVSQGKDGAKIKLMDRHKALNWLADHMDLATEEQKARIDQIRAQTNKITGSEQSSTEDKVSRLFEAIEEEIDNELE